MQLEQGLMIAGIVLAAGRSSRMGEPKALLRLEGRTFLERAATALAEGGCDQVWVVLAPEASPAVAEEARRAGATVVVNAIPGAQQIESLRCGLRALPEDAGAAVVLPVDVPGVDAALVRALVEAQRARGAPVAAPTHGGRHGHPVVFARRVFPELLAGDLADGARGVVHAHAGELAEVAVAALPADVDTPADYRRLLEEG